MVVDGKVVFAVCESDRGFAASAGRQRGRALSARGRQGGVGKDDECVRGGRGAWLLGG